MSLNSCPHRILAFKNSSCFCFQTFGPVLNQPIRQGGTSEELMALLERVLEKHGPGSVGPGSVGRFGLWDLRWNTLNFSGNFSNGISNHKLPWETHVLGVSNLHFSWFWGPRVVMQSLKLPKIYEKIDATELGFLPTLELCWWYFTDWDPMGWKSPSHGSMWDTIFGSLFPFASWPCKSNMIGVQERCLWFKDSLVEDSGYTVEEYSTVDVYYTSTLQR